jgi:hypothetical protein
MNYIGTYNITLNGIYLFYGCASWYVTLVIGDHDCRFLNVRIGWETSGNFTSFYITSHKNKNDHVKKMDDKSKWHGILYV